MGFETYFGELWMAGSYDGAKKGQRVRIIGKDCPILIVELIEKNLNES